MSPRGLGSRRSTWCRGSLFTRRRACRGRRNHRAYAPSTLRSPGGRGGRRRSVPATVTRIEHLGDQSHIHLDLAGRASSRWPTPKLRVSASAMRSGSPSGTPLSLRCQGRAGASMSRSEAAGRNWSRRSPASVDHADELTALDQAIGDGDHGLNMKRGFEAVLADLPTLAQKPLPDLFKAIGMTMVMKVGGASGRWSGPSSWISARRFRPDPAPISSPRPRRRSPASRRVANPSPARRPCSTCWCRFRRSSPRGSRAAPAEAAQASRSGRRPDAGHSRARLLPRRALDRAYGSGLAVLVADDRRLRRIRRRST